MGDWKKDARERVKQMSEGNRLSLTVGDNCIRIAPDKKDLLPDGRVGPKGLQHKPCREFKIHYAVGPDKKTCGCGHDIDGGGSCWYCDVKLPELVKNPNKKQLVKDSAAKDCFVVNASMYNSDTQKFSPFKTWWPSVGGGNSLAVRIYGRMSTSKKDYVDPVKGHNITVKKTGEGINTRYPEIEGDDSPTVVPKDLLAKMKDLDTIVPKYSKEEQMDAHFGRTSQAQADEDEPEDTDTDTGAEETPADETDVDAAESDYEEPAADAEEEPAEEPAEEDAEPDPDAAEEEYEAEPDADADAAEEEYEPEPEPEPEPVKKRPATPAKKQAPAPAEKRPAPAPAKKQAPARRK